MKRFAAVAVVLLLASCSVSESPEPVPMATLHIMPEYVFWGDESHYRVISCDPVVIQVDEASALPLWHVYDVAMWGVCGALWLDGARVKHGVLVK